MFKKINSFTFLFLLYVVVNVATRTEEQSSENVIQSKMIHILDLKGILGALEINATHKDIETLNISGKYKDNLLQALDQRCDLSQTDQIKVNAAAIQQLKEHISSLEKSVSYIRAELAKQNEATSCLEFERFGGVHAISLPGTPPFYVSCDACGGGPGWIVVQRRLDGSVDFYRNWNEYRDGFGYYSGEFFIGLEYIYRLTSSRPYELFIELIDFDSNLKFARYDSFRLGSEQEQYMLRSLGTYSGTAGDSLRYNLYDNFSTYDNDNDRWHQGNCADYYESGWWFGWDANSNLNGRFIKNGVSTAKGIWWYSFNGYYSLKSVRMLIRPRYSLV